MLHARKVSEKERDAELGHRLAGIRPELGRVGSIVLRRENLHRDSNLIDVAFREKGRVADRDTIDEGWLVLARSEAKGSPPAVTEPDCTDKGVCSCILDFRSASPAYKPRRCAKA